MCSSSSTAFDTNSYKELCDIYMSDVIENHESFPALTVVIVSTIVFSSSGGLRTYQHGIPWLPHSQTSRTANQTITSRHAANLHSNSSAANQTARAPQIRATATHQIWQSSSDGNNDIPITRKNASHTFPASSRRTRLLRIP